MKHITKNKNKMISCGWRLAFCFVVVSFTIINLNLSHSVSAASNLSLTISTDTLSVDVPAASTSGIFTTSNTANISITTDRFNGYTLGIKAATSDQGATNLINTIDNTKTINSISSTLSESDFSASSNTQYNNKWGYKPSKYNSSANTTNYYPSPTASGDTLDVTNASNSTANNYTISFGTRINSNVTPGTYSNTYVITAVANPASYSITYNKNTTDNVTNMPTPNPTTGGTYDDHINLSSSTPTRNGYSFVSWCTSNASETSCSGTSYQPSDSFTINQSSNEGNTATLYAIWVREATLDTGQTVNQKLKRLAGNSSASYTTEDNTITALIRSDTLPSGFTPSTENTISASTSITPIYAWYDSENTTIYYYSEANNISMNSNSASFFYMMRTLSDFSTISTWDTSKVTSMHYMFCYTGRNATTWNAGDLSSWDTSKVTDMTSMFNYAGYKATTWSIGNLSSWDTSSVTDMSYMFYYAGYKATTWFIGDISSWDTSKVTDMNGAFSYAGYSVDTFILDLSSWNTSSATYMHEVFKNAGYNATTWSIGDLSSWDTSNITSMSKVFEFAGSNATNWSVGDISSWNTSKVTNMSNMFYYAGRSAASFNLNLSSWDTSKVTNMSNMFTDAGYNATSFNLNLSSWDTSKVTNMSNMFLNTGHNATTWSVIIPKTNNGTATGPILNTTSNLYGSSTSVTATPPSGKSFTLAN